MTESKKSAVPNNCVYRITTVDREGFTTTSDRRTTATGTAAGDQAQEEFEAKAGEPNYLFVCLIYIDAEDDATVLAAHHSEETYG